LPAALATLGVAAWLTTAGAAAAGQIYFYANVGNPIGQFNPPLVKPQTLVLHLDGSWLVVNLRWSGCGSSVARANGISSASNCKPHCANGRRTHDPAQLTLSHPETLHGRRVYGCFQLTIPPPPKGERARVPEARRKRVLLLVGAPVERSSVAERRAAVQALAQAEHVAVATARDLASEPQLVRVLQGLRLERDAAREHAGALLQAVHLDEVVRPERECSSFVGAAVLKRCVSLSSSATRSIAIRKARKNSTYFFTDGFDFSTGRAPPARRGSRGLDRPLRLYEERRASGGVFPP
jgi:hypothetical protein